VARLDLLQRATHAIGERQDLESIFQVVVRSLEDNMPIDFACMCMSRTEPSMSVSTSIDRSQDEQLDSVLAALKERNVLTVADFAAFARRGGVIRFVTVGNKIRMRVNLAAAQQAKLTISSKLLRPAQIVAPGED
jgi:hypothetical protein